MITGSDLTRLRARVSYWSGSSPVHELNGELRSSSHRGVDFCAKRDVLLSLGILNFPSNGKARQDSSGSRTFGRIPHVHFHVAGTVDDGGRWMGLAVRRIDVLVNA
jgi:hypothetical protein